MSHTNKNVVIIGAGLAGSVLSHGISKFASVTVIEGGEGRRPPFGVIDTGYPANIDPHVGGGPGGSTNLWHNGLIDIPKSNLENWPLDPLEFQEWLDRARPILGGVTRNSIDAPYTALANEFKKLGVDPDLFGQPLYYPSRRLNIWKHLQLNRKIKLVKGIVSGIEEFPDKVIVKFDVSGRQSSIEADQVVIAAGGLGTPSVLRSVKIGGRLIDNSNIGGCYEDHPLAFVAEFTGPIEMSYLGNFSHEHLKGRLRMPLVVHEGGVDFAFFIRPSFKWAVEKKSKVKSNLSDLRNNPYSISNYFKILANGGDVIDILSFKFGMHVKTTRFSLLMVSGSLKNRFISIAQNDGVKNVLRNWTISPEYLCIADKAIQRIINKLGKVGSDFDLYHDWKSMIQSSAHHSGTARMALNSRDGVCDSNNLVFGSNRIYVCDGSTIPDSGYANTGLAIAALALRLCKYLKDTI